MKKFHLQRDQDATGVSGTGIVAEGVIFYDGTVAMKWRTAVACVGLYTSIEDVIHIHGHSGMTKVVIE